MPRLPGFEDLGGSQADPTRPTATYDVSPFARGAQAIAQGAENLGRGISTVGTDLAEVRRQQNEALAIDAHANAATAIAGLHTSLQNDKDFPTIEQRYADGAQKIIDDNAQTIPEGPLRQHFIAKTRELSAHVAGAINRQAYNGMVSSDDDDLKLKTQRVLDDIAINPNNPARGAQVDALGLHIDNAVNRGWKTQAEGDLQKRTIAIETRKAEIMPRDYASAVAFEQNFGRTMGKPQIPGLSQTADAWATANQTALQAQGVPVAITSAYRDSAHNAAVGGARGSQHMSGNAVDISLNGLTSEQQQAAVTQFLADPRTGGFGYYPNSNSIHVDVRGGGKAAWGTDYHGSSVGQGWPDWLTNQVQAWQGAPRASASAQPAPAAAGDTAAPERQGIDPIVASINPEWLYRMSQHARTIIELNENSSAKAKKEASDAAASEWMTKIGNGQYDPNGIMRDDRMTWEARHTMSQFAAHASGAPEGSVNMGPAWLDVKRQVLADPSDPQHISDPVEVVRRALPGGDLTPAGANDILRTMDLARKSVDQHGVETSKASLIQYARSKMSFDQEERWPGAPPLKDPEGARIFMGQFVPKFNAAYHQWVTAGKAPMEFLTQENVDKMIVGLRPPWKMKMARLMASGEVKSIPAGVDEQAYDELVLNPPTYGTGVEPTSIKSWAQALEILVNNPSPTRIAQFDQAMTGNKAGLTAADVLAKLKPVPEGFDVTAALPQPKREPPASTGLFSRAVSAAGEAASSFIEGEKAKMGAADKAAAVAAPIVAKENIEAQLRDLDQQQAEAERLPKGSFEYRQRTARIKRNREFFNEQIRGE